MNRRKKVSKLNFSTKLSVGGSMQEEIFTSRVMERTLFVEFPQESFNYLTAVVFSLGQFWLDKVGKVRKSSKNSPY